MAPAATIMVYHVSKYMEVVADSLTFPVNGISRNNVRNWNTSTPHKIKTHNYHSSNPVFAQFTVKINNKKEKTNNLVEIIIRGQPGAFVGLSGIDSAFYTVCIFILLSQSFCSGFLQILYN